MRIKRFVAPDMRQALRMVREDQGADAVVLSSRRTEAGTELLVALDYDAQVVAAMSATDGPASTPSVSATSLPAERPESLAAEEAECPPATPSIAIAHPPNDETLGAVGTELRKLRIALEQQLQWLEMRDGEPAENPLGTWPEPSARLRGSVEAADEWVVPIEGRPRAEMDLDGLSGRRRASPDSRIPARDASLRESAKVLDAEGLDQQAVGAMGSELRKLHSALKQQLDALDARDADQGNDGLLARAERLGLPRELAQELLARVVARGHPRGRLWSGVCAELNGRIARVKDDQVYKGGVLALVGPTGVGKTTTVAKLAARFALRYGRRHVALITTDTYRIGAREQLLTFGELLGIPIDFAANRKELAGLLHEHASKRLVLIDNAGLSQRDFRLAAQLGDLDGTPSIKSYLVASCITHPAGLDETFRAFGRARLHGCILTKLDEAVTLGPVLGALVRHQLPLVYASDGQRVPEDLHPAGVVDLVERAEALAWEAGSIPGQHETFVEQRAANGSL
ncbi:flagellar biosynthesis protein FlhF [Thioalkalicoccus limnaeus]|uniref:Flagellar biosynthesis protein FlhF n=1 Tax=Thioalkalicoccus limnaeus TaxID=120681 RepID=A0ABV4BEY5_9GAMM